MSSTLGNAENRGEPDCGADTESQEDATTQTESTPAEPDKLDQPADLATVKPTSDDELLRDVAQHVKNYPDCYCEAGKWVDDNASPGAIVDRQRRRKGEAHKRLEWDLGRAITDDDPVAELLPDIDEQDDITMYDCFLEVWAAILQRVADWKDKKRLKRAEVGRQLLYLVWLATDPDVEEEGSGLSFLEKWRWNPHDTEKGAVPNVVFCDDRHGDRPNPSDGPLDRRYARDCLTPEVLLLVRNVWEAIGPSGIEPILISTRVVLQRFHTSTSTLGRHRDKLTDHRRRGHATNTERVYDEREVEKLYVRKAVRPN